jgi:hypothetical protein
MVVHTCNSRLRKLRQENCEFETNLGYIGQAGLHRGTLPPKAKQKSSIFTYITFSPAPSQLWKIGIPTSQKK